MWSYLQLKEGTLSTWISSRVIARTNKEVEEEELAASEKKK